MKKAIQISMSLVLSMGLSMGATAAGLDEIPAEIREKVYNPKLTDPAQPLGESVYREWKTERKPPWTIGYASTYAGNTCVKVPCNGCWVRLRPSGSSSGC